MCCQLAVMRVFMILAVVVQLIAVSRAELYDVTTIYRFGRDFLTDAENKSEIQVINCAPENGCDEWEFSNDAPEVAPLLTQQPISNRTSTSFIASWEPPLECSRFNGYLTDYRYRLIPQDQSLPLVDKSTTDTSALFTDLEPHVNYTVQVYAQTAAGWNRDYVLEIPVKTRASVPEVVTNLTVYKRGRRMLGLRWSKALHSGGILQYFTISYHAQGDVSVQIKVTPTPCVAWPDLFCHTIKRLKPDNVYEVAVQARNVEVDEDGDAVIVTATTKEAAPEVVSYVKVVNMTDESLTVEWGLPDLINGELRSFLISIEETDSFNSTDCCQYFPLREVVVQREEAKYHFQLEGLRPASTYAISVSGKTALLGPALSITASTRPQTPGALFLKFMRSEMSRI